MDSDDPTSTAANPAPEPQEPSTPAPPPPSPAAPAASRKGTLIGFAAGLLLPTVFIGGFFAGAAWNGGNSEASSAPAAPTTAPVAPSSTPPGPTPEEPTPKAGDENIVTPKGTSGPGTPYVFGNPDGPTLSIVEDFSCPFCALFEQKQGPAIKQAVAEQKIQVKYYTPAFFGEGSQKWAEAAGCAADQDAYQSFAALIYAGQTPENQAVTDEQVIKVAKNPESGIQDQGTFAACLKAGTYADYVKSMTAASDTIPGTPSIFINGDFIQPDQVETQVTNLLTSVSAQ